MIKTLWSFRRDEQGVTAVEYAVLLALILVAVIIAIDAVGGTNSGIWANDAGKISSAIGSV